MYKLAVSSQPAWTHTASHLPTSSAVQGQNAQEDETGAGAVPQESSPLTFLLVQAMDLMGKAREGSAAAVQPPYLSQLHCRDSEHNATGHQRQRHDAYGRSQAAAQDPIPAAGACELSAPRCTHLCHGVQHPLQTHLLLLPSQQEQVERDRL